jgi:hypothetical protein
MVDCSDGDEVSSMDVDDDGCADRDSGAAGGAARAGDVGGDCEPVEAWAAADREPLGL